MLSLNYITCIN